MVTARKDQRPLEMALLPKLGKQEKGKVPQVQVPFATTSPA